MTAPYQRIYVPNAVAQNRNRVKKSENMDMLPDIFDPVYPDPVTSERVTEDDGSSPTGYLFPSTSYLLQQGIVHAGIEFLAIGGWTPGSGTQFLFGLAITPFSEWANGGFPLGYGVSIDDSTGAQTPVYFEANVVTPFPVAGFIYAQAVVWATGAVVGPGVPYTWATGDTVFKGNLTYGVDWPETITVTP